MSPEPLATRYPLPITYYMPPLRLLKQRLKRAYYAARGLRPDIRIPVTTVNPGDQAWYFAEGSLNSNDIVYSLGLATNIEFDLNLIRDFGVQIHGFDPTPESVDWIKRQTLPPQFHHHPVAIAAHDGELIFELPDQEGHCARAVNTGDQKLEGRSQKSAARPPALATGHRPPATRHPPPSPSPAAASRRSCMNSATTALLC